MERSCTRCGEVATTVVIQVGALELSLDLCELHVADLLRGSRRQVDATLPPSGLTDPLTSTRPRRLRGRTPERLGP